MFGGGEWVVFVCIGWLVLHVSVSYRKNERSLLRIRIFSYNCTFTADCRNNIVIIAGLLRP